MTTICTVPEHNTQFFVILGPFFATKIQPQKSKFWKNKKKQLGDRQFFFPFWAFFVLLPHYWPQKLKFGKNVKNTWKYYHFTLVNHKWRSFDVWCLRYKVWQTEFLVILGHLGPGDIIILHKCTKNYDQMIYGSWDMVHNRRTNGQTDGWTDGNIWTDGHITVGGQPKMLSISILYSLTRKERHSNSVNFKRYYRFTSNNMANIILVYTLLLFDSPEGL